MYLLYKIKSFYVYVQHDWFQISTTSWFNQDLTVICHDGETFTIIVSYKYGKYGNLKLPYQTGYTYLASSVVPMSDILTMIISR